MNDPNVLKKRFRDKFFARQETMRGSPVPQAVVLFDGVCHFCDAAVRFIIARDPTGRFRFASLQSPLAERLLEGRGCASDARDSIVLIEGEACFERSTAALRIARRLRWPWPILAVGLLVPRPMRDAAYDFVANRRYRWFGRREHCRIPGPEERARFLDL
jgi:predicted DCC family thiol-disulfide oxidoreductase YuxK